ncbi:C6 transcription factor [Colletotrichum kahawae]|uniref:C6 transcription factor n=1 Tax=Colletotrichum kahawae TaxID=34407 RepID=A0AAE0DCC2_COLKA|nr:C6 transcription factor [Colletotrichum kahawae]
MPPAPSSRRVRRRRIAEEDRQRAPRACTRCKTRKSKCIETPSGICQGCQQGSYTCSFERQETPTPGPRDLEASAQHQTPPSNLTPTSNAGPLADGPEDPPSRRDLCSDGDAPENFMWPRFLSRLRNAFYLEPHPSPAERDMARLEADLAYTSSIPKSAEGLRLQAAIGTLPPWPVADFLATLCIMHGTDCFFYFNQREFLSELREFYDNDKSPLRRDASFVCLLLAVFALGSQWTPRARPEGIDAPICAGDPGQVFGDHARILMADTMDRVSMYSVKAAFVLGAYLMPSSAIGASYLYMGLALRKALILGLHQESDDPSILEHEKEMRRRLWWAIYSLERTLTIKLNRPRSVTQDIIAARLPDLTFDDDVGQPYCNVVQQVANATFVKVIDKLVEPANWSNDSQLPLEEYCDLLKSYKNTHLKYLDLTYRDPRSPHYRAIFHLHLNYHFAWIAIGKSSVVANTRSYLRKIHSRDVDLAEIIRMSGPFRYCKKAAKKMLGLLESASESGNLAPSSFTDFQACSIATIMLVLTGITSRDPEYNAQVAFGLDCLRKMSNMHTAGRMAINFVKALMAIAEEARSKLNIEMEALGAQEAREERSSELAYVAWADWFSSTTGVSGIAPSAPRGLLSNPVTSEPGGRLWEEASALLQLRNLSTPGMSRPTRNQPGLDSNHTGDDMLPQTAANQREPSVEIDLNIDLQMFNENHMQLMGLTGMDMLDLDFGFN